MHVLLTGADGFIGHHLARGIRAAGHTLTSAVFARAPGAGEVRVDLTDAAALAQLPADVEAVVNASGVVDPRVPAQRMFAVNRDAARALAQWAKLCGVRHFVQLSSVAVYGPLVVGEGRSERAPRLGLALGLPYMRSKAQAEFAIERTGVPHTLLRPAAVLGAGDNVVSPGFAQALSGPGIPLVSGASPARRVSLTLVDGLVDMVLRLLLRGPLNEPVHAVDVELSLGELAALFAAELGRPCHFTRTSWREVSARRADAGFGWLVASARFGQHYSRERQIARLGPGPVPNLAQAIQAGVSSLQGGISALS